MKKMLVIAAGLVMITTTLAQADSIRRIFADDSVSEIFAGENQLF